MVNAVHPTTPHISGVRAWRFAQELACLGHRVVMLTARRELHDGDAVSTFASHDWREPMVLACARGDNGLALPRSVPLRKAATVVRMLRHGGSRGAWVEEAVRSMVRMNAAFRPDVVWCTFGMLESVMAGKRIAASAGCPWVLDVKDNWELYVPRGVRRLMAWRIRGWSAITANSQLTADLVAKWQKATASVVYSGVESEYYPASQVARTQRPMFVLNLIGSIYFPELLGELFDGVRLWLDQLSQKERANVLLRYLGGDGQRVKAAALLHLRDLEIDVAGYVTTTRMASYCKEAAVNAYVAHPSTFHHKLLELLACARPILVFPSERQESLDLVAATGGSLVVANSRETVARALALLHAQWGEGSTAAANIVPAHRYSWPSQTLELERVLARATNAV